MSAFLVLLRKELVEHWRTMRLPSVLVVFLFVGIASPAGARYMPELMGAIGGPSFAAAFPPPTALDAYAQLAKNITQLGALVVIVIAMTSISSERERGTLAFVLSKPIGRAPFLAAKLAALAVTLLAGMAVAAIAAFAYTALLFGAPGGGFALLVLAAYLALLVFGTVTLAASAVTGSGVAAAGVGVVALVVFGVVSMLPNVGAYTPAGTVSRAVEVAAGGAAASVTGPAVAQVAIVVLAFAVALAAFERQEI